jgi:hypothetical protein
MTNVVLTLGDFQFTRFEVPEEIPFGGDQRLVTHTLVGGARVVDAMGEDPLVLDWSGIFTGASAEQRSRYLDTLRKAGGELTLTWASFRYKVAIKSFHATYRAPFRIPYRIECQVIQDLTQPVTTPPPYDAGKVITADNAKAQAVGAIIGDSALSGALSGLDKAIKSVSDFAKATQREINSVLEPIRDAQARISVLRAASVGTLRNLSSFGGFLPNNPIAQGVNALVAQTDAAVQSAHLKLLSGSLGRIANNTISAPSGPKKVTVAATNLYAVAAAQYGDPMAWTTLARANGLKDPMIRDVATLAVPNTTPDTSGVLNA